MKGSESIVCTTHMLEAARTNRRFLGEMYARFSSCPEYLPHQPRRGMEILLAAVGACVAIMMGSITAFRGVFNGGSENRYNTSIGSGESYDMFVHSMRRGRF